MHQNGFAAKRTDVNQVFLTSAGIFNKSFEVSKKSVSLGFEMFLHAEMNTNSCLMLRWHSHSCVVQGLVAPEVWACVAK